MDVQLLDLVSSNLGGNISVTLLLLTTSQISVQAYRIDSAN